MYILVFKRDWKISDLITVINSYLVDSKPATSKRQRQDKFQEDSSSDEESDSVPPKRSKPLHTPTKTTKLVSSDSDSDVAETGGNDLSDEIAESGQDDLSGEIPAKPSSTVSGATSLIIVSLLFIYGMF